MPELPEVETVAKGLEQALIGDSFCKIILRRENLRFPFPEDFAKTLSNKQIIRIGRRAKYLLLTLEDGTVLIAHLGMSGSFRIEKTPVDAYDKHDHVIFETKKGITVRYHDPRRFGFMLLTREDEMDHHPLLASIGPEPLGNAFSGPVLGERLAGRKGPIKTALLDQKVVAGIGNIYACEALHRSHISPQRISGAIKGDHADRLVKAVRNVLEEAIKAGGSTLRNYSTTSGELGYFQHSFKVYGKEDEACPTKTCSGIIQRITQAGRSTFYCPACQK